MAWGVKARANQERDKVTQEWYRLINEFQPMEGREYGWVLDYARFRLEWAFEKTRYVEEKSQALVKLILAVTAGSWAVFSVLLPGGQPVFMGTTVFAVLALVCLLISTYYTLQASNPADHVYPAGEDKAIEYANFYAGKEAALARFALKLGDSSEQERILTIEKSMQMNRGVCFVVASVISFSLALFAQVFR